MKLLAKLFRFLLLLIAIPLGVLGILLTTIRFVVTDLDLHNNAVEESGLYELLDDPTIYFDAGDDDVQVILAPIIEELDVPFLAQETAESNVVYLINWIKGDELFVYFPRTTLEETFSSVEFRDVVVQSFEDAFNDLPECSPAEEQEYFGEDGEFEGETEDDFLPPCKPQDFDDVFEENRAEFEAEIDEVLGQDDSFEALLEEVELEFATEQTPIEDVLVNIEESEGNEDTNEIRDAIDVAEQILTVLNLAGPLLIVLSLIMIGIVAVTRSKDWKVMANTVLNNYVLIGFVLSLLAIIFIAARNVGISEIPFDEISEDAVYEPIEASIEFIVRSVSLSVVSTIATVSFGVLSVSVVGRGMLMFAGNKNQGKVVGEGKNALEKPKIENDKN